MTRRILIKRGHSINYLQFISTSIHKNVHVIDWNAITKGGLEVNSLTDRWAYFLYILL